MSSVFQRARAYCNDHVIMCIHCPRATTVFHSRSSFRTIHIFTMPLNKPSKKSATQKPGRGRGKQSTSKNTTTGESTATPSKSSNRSLGKGRGAKHAKAIIATPSVVQVVLEEDAGSRSPVMPHADSGESHASTVQDNNPKKSKKATSLNNLSPAEEELMCEFLEANPMIWNNRLQEYRRSDKKGRLWAEQAEALHKTSTHIQVGGSRSVTATLGWTGRRAETVRLNPQSESSG